MKKQSTKAASPKKRSYAAPTKKNKLGQFTTEVFETKKLSFKQGLSVGILIGAILLSVFIILLTEIDL